MRITGKLPSGRLRERIRKSPQYKLKGFENTSPTPMMADDASYWKLTKDFFRKNANVAPPGLIPHVKTDLGKISQHTAITWFGHSSYLLQIDGKNILVDPVFSGNAAPVSFMVKAFKGSDAYKPADMPVIDHLVLTHDHYDHLDYKTVLLLKKKVRHIYCSLGISSHLIYWGFDSNIITELDWWESANDDGIKITAAPARHFSGRGIKRAQTLWSSFILEAAGKKIYLGGDSGYDEHFRIIGRDHGPFDLVILECGQYNTMWPLIHMMPEETVQAALDLNARMLLPVHWGKFTLAMHPWDEPIKRLLAKAIDVNLPVITPMIGETIILDKTIKTGNWWEKVSAR